MKGFNVTVTLELAGRTWRFNSIGWFQRVCFDFDRSARQMSECANRSALIRTKTYKVVQFEMILFGKDVLFCKLELFVYSRC